MNRIEFRQLHSKARKEAREAALAAYKAGRRNHGTRVQRCEVFASDAGPASIWVEREVSHLYQTSTAPLCRTEGPTRVVLRTIVDRAWRGRVAAELQWAATYRKARNWTAARLCLADARSVRTALAPLP